MTERKAAARLGTVFAGKYKLRRVIGLGGMGAVYEAVHAFTGKPCAVKVLDASAADTPGYAARFLREARAAAEIGHQAIVDVYDAGQEEDGSLYLVLELLEGSDLGAAIKRGDLSTSEIVEIGVQVLEGLSAAHERGIIHRDVKPENVFLTRDESGTLKVKLLDFGVAKNVRDTAMLFNTQQGLVVGTPFYMSPEQAGGSAVDRRADVWSTGAMLFHALAGRPPFIADNYNKLILQILSDAPPSLRDHRPDLPEWLIRMIDGALRVDPGARWHTAAQMATGLRNQGMAPIVLDWEANEDATTRTPSPFEHQEDISPPFESLGVSTPPASPRAGLSPAGSLESSGIEIDVELTETLAVTPPLKPPVAPAETPQAWDRPAPARRPSSGFLVGVLVGAGVVLLAGLGLAAYLVFGAGTWSAAPAERAARPLLLTPDAGPDAAADAAPESSR